MNQLLIIDSKTPASMYRMTPGSILFVQGDPSFKFYSTGLPQLIFYLWCNDRPQLLFSLYWMTPTLFIYTVWPHLFVHDDLIFYYMHTGTVSGWLKLLFYLYRMTPIVFIYTVRVWPQHYLFAKDDPTFCPRIAVVQGYTPTPAPSALSGYPGKSIGLSHALSPLQVSKVNF
jgi:hypothetical protein